MWAPPEQPASVSVSAARGENGLGGRLVWCLRSRQRASVAFGTRVMSVW